MNKKQKEGIVRAELDKSHHFGELKGDEHVSSSGIAALYVGKETKKEGAVTFPFSAEIERTSEFGTQLFWEYGSITLKKDGTIEPRMGVKMFGTSFMVPHPLKNVFLPEKDRKRFEKTIKRVRKELHLSVRE